MASPFLWNPVSADQSQQSQSGLYNTGSLAGGYSLGNGGGSGFGQFQQPNSIFTYPGQTTQQQGQAQPLLQPQSQPSASPMQSVAPDSPPLREPPLRQPPMQTLSQLGQGFNDWQTQQQAPLSQIAFGQTNPMNLPQQAWQQMGGSGNAPSNAIINPQQFYQGWGNGFYGV